MAEWFAPRGVGGTTPRGSRGTARHARRTARAIAAGLGAAALAVLSLTAPAWAAAPSFVDPPTRLYMLPNADGPLPAPIPFPLVPDGVLLFDSSQDLISQDLRKLEVESAESDCTPGPEWNMTGCTAVQLSVGHGLLDFTGAPTAQDDSDSVFDVYQLPGGALVRDMDSSDDLPALATAVIGTTAQVNAALATLRYTPEADYYYNGSNPETLDVDLVPGDPALGSVTITTDIRVQDLNDFPEVIAPADLFTATGGDPNEEIVLGTAAQWDVADEDNDEVVDDEDPPGIDGPGQQFILIAWTSCGQFHFQAASGFALHDDLEELISDALDFTGSQDPAHQQAIIDAFLEIVPDDIEQLPFATGSPNNYATAFAGVVDDISWLDYALDEVSFTPVDPVTMLPLEDALCDVRFLVTDIGNNGLPLQYLGDPPEGMEVPFFGFDLDTNDVPAVEKVSVQVGAGIEVDVTLPTDVVVAEGASDVVPVAISPAEHPAFDLTVSTTPGPGTTADADYTSLTAVTVPVAADAASATIPVDALQDLLVDPGETYTVTVTPPGTDPPGYDVISSDPSAIVTITDDDPADVTPPSVTIDQGAAQVDPTGVSPIVFDVVFSEPVVGFDSGDVVLGGTAGATTAVVSGAGPSYTVEVSGMTADGTVIATVPAAAATDLAALPSGASTSTDNTVTFEFDEGDVTPPSVTIDQGAAQVDPTDVSPIVFDVVFSEPVIGFDAADVVLSGTAGATTAVVSGAGPSYTVEVSGMTGDGTVIATVPAAAAVDLAALPSGASTSTDNTVTFEFDEGDVTPPSVTIDQGAAQVDPTDVSPIVFDVVFSEPVVGFDSGDVVLGGTAGATTAVVSGAGPAYTVSVSGMTADGTVIATVPAAAATDLAALPSEASTSIDNSVTFEFDEGDVTPPSVTIDQGAAQVDPTGVSPIVFDVVFSEPVVGFDSGDVVLGGTAGATTAVVSGAGPAYTVSVSGMTADGTVIATVPAAAATDLAALPSGASTSTDNTVTFEFDEGDVTPPSVTIDQGAAQVDPTGVSPIVFDVVFSEPISGFDASDVVLTGTAGATTAVISGAGPAYTVEVSGMTADGTVIASIAAGAVIDAAALPSAASTSTDNQVTFALAMEPSPLTIDVPDDIVIEAPNGAPGVAVDFPTPTTSGGTPPVTVVCDHASGDVFPIGVTTVTCTATDSAVEEIVLFAVVSDSFTITVTEVSDDPGTPGDPGGGSTTGGGTGSGTGTGSGLASTGADSLPPAVIAALLLFAGAAALRFARRRVTVRAR